MSRDPMLDVVNRPARNVRRRMLWLVLFAFVMGLLVGALYGR